MSKSLLRDIFIASATVEAEGFDPIYMKKLFERGYQMAINGYPWDKAPPGFILSD